MEHSRYPSTRAKDKKLDAWVNEPIQVYKEEKETEEIVNVSAYLPRSAYDQIIRDVLPQLYGKKWARMANHVSQPWQIIFAI